MNGAASRGRAFLLFTSYRNMQEVHRLLKEIKHGRYPGKRIPTIKRLLTRVGEHSSQRERIAEEAERETVKIKQAVYLSRHIGDVFEGISTYAPILQDLFIDPVHVAG